MRAVRAILVTSVLVAAMHGHAQTMPDDFAISMRRTRCFGTCPAYEVSIDANGNVTYRGDFAVRVEGNRTARIPKAQVEALAAAVERSGFFKLQNRYTAPITDIQTTYVTVTSNGRRKRVEDYYGAPESLRALEANIDATAGTARWIRIDVDTLERLFRDGPRPLTPALNEMLREALGADEIDVVNALLKHGVDVKSSFDGVPWLMFAGSAAAVRALLDAGANPEATDRNGETALHAAANRPAEVAVALIKGGARIEGGTSGVSPLYNAACAGNVGVVKVLLEAGANPAAQFGGLTALDCVRSEKNARESNPGLFWFEKPPDFTALIALLESALAKSKPQF